jgi:5'-nucleotidase
MTRLRVFHINDTHSHIDGSSIELGLSPSRSEPTSISCGGYALIHAFVRAERAKARRKGIPTLFLHAGDCFEGSLYFALFRGRADVTLLNRMGLDAMTAGNHEFDRGDHLLASFARRAKFPILCSNLTFEKNTPKHSPLYRERSSLIHYDENDGARYIVRKFGNDRIALFGLTLETMADIAAPSEAIGFLNPHRVAHEVVAHAQSVGINKIILLSHLGIERDRALAEAVPGISLIVGGHSHTLQGDFTSLGLTAETEYAEAVDSSLIVHAGHNAMAVGMSDLVFDENGRATLLDGGNKILFDFRERRLLKAISIPTESGISDLYSRLKLQTNVAIVKETDKFRRLLTRKFARPVAKMRNKVVATCSHDLAYDRLGRCGDPDSICTLVADAMLHRSSTMGVPGDFAIINAGAVRGGVRRGSLTASDIYGRLLPFPITLVAVRVSGADVVRAIAGALQNALLTPGGTGSFPYAAGLSYSYVVEDKGVSVSQVVLQDMCTGLFKPIEAPSFYIALVTSYMARGMEGYGSLKSGTAVVTQALIADLLVDHMARGKVSR